MLAQASTILKDLQIFNIEIEGFNKRVDIFKILPGDSNRQLLLISPDFSQNFSEGTESSNQIAVLNQESGDVLSQIAARCRFSVYSDVEQWNSAASAISRSASVGTTW